ncbi:MAG: protein kinase [Planctomycetota bacterium]|nr:protein kinase [Planctomycetota bacterium]
MKESAKNPSEQSKTTEVELPDRPVAIKADLNPGDRIGHYVIREPIGEGGFATVYLAEQTEPVSRRVALKMIKLGMDSKEVLARFEAERQALALMDHANVARVFDAGVSDSGRPYFIMEYVPGDSITDYCDKQRLSVEARLDLFVQACAAVQHAHQKGIIHRDIKPTNVLVTSMDGKPTVKVIDFGVAKALHQRLTDSTVHTMHGQFLGTPEYMSPEQAEMTGSDVDTRTDIYSLGVLLYELLTGETPFESERLRSASYLDIQRIIREEDPPKPSTRLSTMDDRLVEVARHRHTEVRPLTKSVRGELDWIVMKCLDKDRTRRYETCNGLAMDLQRYLDDEPVMAGPPSTTYRVRKFLHRNRLAVAAGATVCLALLIGMTLAVIFAVRANRFAEQANMAKIEAEEHQQHLLVEQARLQATQGELQDLYDRYGHLSMALMPLTNTSGDPEQDAFASGMTTTLFNELANIESLHLKSLEASKKLWSLDVSRSPKDFANEMKVDLLLQGNAIRIGERVQINVWLMHGADGQRFWGQMYDGDWSEIEVLKRQVLEDVAAAVKLKLPRDEMRLAINEPRDLRAWEAYAKGLLKMEAPDHDDIEKAIEFFTQAIEIDQEYAQAYVARANAYYTMLLMGIRIPHEFMPQARNDALRAIELDSTLAEAWSVLGLVRLHYDWDWKGAEQAFAKGLELNPNSAMAHIGLAAYYTSAGQFDIAIEHLYTAVRLDPATLLVHDQYRYVPFNARKFDIAIEFAEKAFELDDGYWQTHAWYGISLAYADRIDEAIVAVDEAVRLENDIPMARVLQTTVYAMAGRKVEAKVMLDELLDLTRSGYTCPYEVATVFLALGQTETALEYLNAAVEYRSECMPFLGSDIRMDVLRDHPEFQKIMDDVDVMYRGPESSENGR